MAGNGYIFSANFHFIHSIVSGNDGSPSKPRACLSMNMDEHTLETSSSIQVYLKIYFQLLFRVTFSTLGARTGEKAPIFRCQWRRCGSHGIAMETALRRQPSNDICPICLEESFHGISSASDMWRMELQNGRCDLVLLIFQYE